MAKWQFPGAPAFLAAQGRRLGVGQKLLDQARHNPEIYRASVLCAQLSDRHVRAPRAEDGSLAIGRGELAQVAGTIGQVEQESEKLHALAAAAEAMLAEAYRAFGLEPPPRPFRVRCDFDDLPDPDPADQGESMNVPIPNNDTPGNRATLGYGNLGRQAGDVKPANMPGAAGDRRGGSANLAYQPSPVNVPNHRFAVGTSKMPQPDSAIAPGSGAIPVEPGHPVAPVGNAFDQARVDAGGTLRMPSPRR